MMMEQRGFWPRPANGAMIHHFHIEGNTPYRKEMGLGKPALPMLPFGCRICVRLWNEGRTRSNRRRQGRHRVISRAGDRKGERAEQRARTHTFVDLVCGCAPPGLLISEGVSFATLTD
ncbi:hypothetical protein Ddc_10381 [Ditylenchus destructor]|nr:hypothetical protein Ddc_10381 [Ditylenchus destructor]